MTLSFTSSAQCANPSTVVSNSLTIQVKPKPTKPIVNRIDANTLQCSVIGDGYVWKKDGLVLTTGNGNRTLTTTGKADYQVFVIVNGCTSDISDPFNVSAVMTFAEMGVRVFPNPATDKIFVYLPASLMAQQNTFKLFSISGEEIQMEVIKTNGGVMLPVETVASGVYLLEVENIDGKAIHRINIQH